MKAPETRSRLAQVELDAATSTPAEFAKFVRAEYEKWGRVIKAAGIRVQQQQGTGVCRSCAENGSPPALD